MKLSQIRIPRARKPGGSNFIMTETVTAIFEFLAVLMKNDDKQIELKL